MENAQQLGATADQVAGDANGAVAHAAQQLAEVGQYLQQVRDICENSTQTAAVLLGENHSGVEPITGSAAQVTEAVLQVQGMLTQLDLEIDGLTGVINAHAEMMRDIAGRAMGGGA